MAGIFAQGFFPGIILATSFPMTCGSCSPAEPSSVLDRSNAFGPVILISHRSFACDPMIETRQSPGRSASACSMMAPISDRTTGTQLVCCNPTETAIRPKISPCLPLPQTMRRRSRITERR
jgi:hypothetical protein